MMQRERLQYTIPSAKLASSDIVHGELRLHAFQAEALNVIAGSEKCLVEVHAGTGMGKTAIAVMASLDSDSNAAIMVYPTNELIENQAQSIKKTCAKIGVPNPEIAVVHAAEIMSVMLQEQLKSKAQALKDKLYPRIDGGPKFVLTNPDTLHLILRLKYGGEKRHGLMAAEVIKCLAAYSTLVIDEFHSYQRRELSSLYFDLGLARFMGAFSKILLMTATPQPGVGKYLDRLASAGSLTRLKPIVAEPEDAGFVVSHDVLLTMVHMEDTELSEMANFLVSMAVELRTARQSNPSEEYIPACVILDSVIDARSLTENLLSSGAFTGAEVRESHGLVPHKMRRNRKGALVLVGTSAIEVGIDFDTSRLIFEATDASSAIQRLGRVGRHRPGEALLFVPRFVLNYFKNYVTSVKSRADFTEAIVNAYGERDPGLWYLESAFARREAVLLLMEITEAVESTPAARSYSSSGALEQMLSDLYGRVTDDPDIGDWVKLIDKCAETLSTLRSSQPAVLVHDHVAERKGFCPVYYSPLSRVLRRASRFKVHSEDASSALKTVYAARASAVDEMTRSTIDDMIDEYHIQVRAGRKVCIVDVFGYMGGKSRSVRMRLAGRFPKTAQFRPIAGVNERDFLGTTLGFDLKDEPIDILDSLYEGEMYAIVDEQTSRRLGWGMESYWVVDDRSTGRAYFNANALVALACYNHFGRQPHSMGDEEL